ncbi:hypothetical protein LCGC14_2970670 [marine sediment metagenome]|uniref:Uncharacterized protein n=1 Tax=marine sediment metagenome TaxID=412755 RepID=A0A0F8XAD8_9ZZZZ
MTQYAEQASHTPLPWTVEWNGRQRLEIAGPGEADYMIGHVFIESPCAEANAKYIVQACNNYPAMLNVLRNVADAPLTHVSHRLRVDARAILANIDKTKKIKVMP